jgi:hypothetical protein
MRLSVIHVLLAFLIAAFAIGTPLPVRADCTTCRDCAVDTPAKDQGSCPHEAAVCQVASTCSNLLQKMPAQLTVGASHTAAKIAFGETFSLAIKLADITPETAPPRL